MSLIRGYLIGTTFRALDHRFGSFKLLFDWIFELVHFIEIDGPQSIRGWSGCILWKMAPFAGMISRILTLCKYPHQIMIPQ
jgi:hypothetical protein